MQCESVSEKKTGVEGVGGDQAWKTVFTVVNEESQSGESEKMLADLLSEAVSSSSSSSRPEQQASERRRSKKQDAL